MNDERWEEQETHPTLTPDAATQNMLVAETWAFESRYVRNGRGEPERETVMPLKAQSGRTGKGDSAPLIFSAEGSPAKTSPSPDSEPDSTATGPDSSSSSPASLTLFDLAGYSWRTFPVSTQALDEIGKRGLIAAALTSQLLLERWPASGTYSPGELSIAVSSECRSDDDGCSSLASSLTEILEPPQDVPAKYSLSARAAAGILRRAEKRGRDLPEHLHRALTTVAQSKDGSAKAEAGQPPPRKPPKGI